MVPMVKRGDSNRTVNTVEFVDEDEIEEQVDTEKEQMMDENMGTDDNTTSRSKRILKTAVSLFIGNDHTKKTGKYYGRFEENIYLITEDSETIGAFLYAPKTVNKDTQYFVICHGKGCDRYQIRCILDFPVLSEKNNTCLLLIDYRGFADSSGEYTICGVNYDILAAFCYLKEQYNAPSISLIGHSLGTAAVMEYGRFSLEKATDFIPKRIFVISPFTSTLEICREFTLFTFISFFIPNINNIIEESFNYNSVFNARLLGDRLFVFHGSKDKIISLRHGKAIAKAANCPLIITDHSHVNIFTDFSTWENIFKENARSNLNN
ncbi:abhydrolase domain-containing protein 12 [Pancytospora epiphaga]|nr:abhydrolase domain-containing protein 12 [Pancytospora epiphaga]